MDYARDNVGLAESDLDNVFKYVPRESTVVEMLGGSRYTPVISTLNSRHQSACDEFELDDSELDGLAPDGSELEPDDWRPWLKQLNDKLEGTPDSCYLESGLVLVLARRAGEDTTERVSGVSRAEWLESLGKRPSSAARTPQANPLSGFSEKAIAALMAVSGSDDLQALRQQVAPKRDTRRGVRTLPFSKTIFRHLTCTLRIHGSIAKAVSRSDVPMFSFDQVEMGEQAPAYVYNCRTSNAWDDDLALSATHFPKSRLTLAIVYGTTITMEKDIINRLELVRQEAMHPLLLPGLFSELERARHDQLVKEMGVRLEAKILEFQVNAEELKGRVDAEHRHSRNKAKREAWLNAVYLKNSLLTWQTQIRNMLAHSPEFEGDFSAEPIRTLSWGAKSEASTGSEGSASSEATAISGKTLVEEPEESQEYPGSEPNRLPGDNLKARQAAMSFTQPLKRKSDGDSKVQDADRLKLYADLMKREETLRRTGKKIKGRLSNIKDEYDDWVRDCSMRVDGMAMATQWASGETNVEIALSTRRDSKYMRSIAMLTMIFLPGTWLAGVFSMTFFDWKTEDGAFVSSFLWIYIVATIILTSLTVGCWYYVTVCWPKRMRALRCKEEEDEEFMVGGEARCEMRRVGHARDLMGWAQRALRNVYK